MRKLILPLLMALALLGTFNQAQAASSWLRNLSCQVEFVPGDHPLDDLVTDVNQAKHSIFMAAYGFSYKPLGTALDNAAARGVQVLIVLDRSNLTASYSLMSDMVAHGITVFVVEHHFAIMHNKFTVIDGFTTELGSINYTNSGENSNAENSIFCHSTKLANAYAAEWQALANLGVKQ